MSSDQYDARPPILPSESVLADEAFMRMATKWFDVDERTIYGWLSADEPVLRLVSNLRSVFKAGYVLGRREADLSIRR